MSNILKGVLYDIAPTRSMCGKAILLLCEHVPVTTVAAGKKVALSMGLPLDNETLLGSLKQLEEQLNLLRMEILKDLCSRMNTYIGCAYSWSRSQMFNGFLEGMNKYPLVGGETAQELAMWYVKVSNHVAQNPDRESERCLNRMTLLNLASNIYAGDILKRIIGILVNESLSFEEKNFNDPEFLEYYIRILFKYKEPSSSCQQENRLSYTSILRVLDWYITDELKTRIEL